MKMAEMAETAGEQKARAKKMEAGPTPVSQSGPRLHLEPHHVKKLGIGDGAAPGAEYHIAAHGRVTDASAGREEEGPRIVIELHHMGAEPGGKGGTVREDLEDAAESVEKRDAGTARTGKKIPEKKGGDGW